MSISPVDQTLSQTKDTNRLRILVLAPFCNPDRVSMPLISYLHASALAELHDVSLVVGAPSAENVRNANGPFRSIEVIEQPFMDGLYDWSFRNLFRNNFASQALTGFSYPFALAFEWSAWRKLRDRIFAGEFDVVLRILPMTAVLPSPFAFFLRKGPIPFVIGPINGGLPFVQGFSQAEGQKEWVSNLRDLYRFLPLSRSTYRHASAIIAASSHTFAEFAPYSDKVFFVPENGISRSLCSVDSRGAKQDDKLQFIFVGGLIPCKACDLALRASASLLKSGQARFTVLGDGPDRRKLEELTRSLGIENEVSFEGWVSHAEVLTSMSSADVMVFPSVRDFGAGVIYEALATGAVPVVADFGGPGDVVHPEVGFKISLTNEEDFVTQMEAVLRGLAANRSLLGQLREHGMTYARENLTWEAKARAVTRVLHWVLGRGPRPEFPPPRALTTRFQATHPEPYRAQEV
jgi:glycosyltransferase involved in cell wall biosynthesis